MLRFVFLSIIFFVVSTSAHAHKVVASGWTDGADIEGEVGFSNGELAKDGTVIQIFDKQGNVLGETTITGDGLFRFTPTKAIAHEFVANLGAGHVARFVMEVDELPEPLNAAAGQEVAQTTTAVSENSSRNMAGVAEIERIVAKAVRKEVQPLRKEIAQYKEKNDLQSILGGIGYILGITGIGFYIGTRRKEGKKA